MPTYGTSIAVDDTLTIEPPPLFFIARIAYWVP
jgi:hypothetical protein